MANLITHVPQGHQPYTYAAPDETARTGTYGQTMFANHRPEKSVNETDPANGDSPTGIEPTPAELDTDSINVRVRCNEHNASATDHKRPPRLSRRAAQSTRPYRHIC